MYEGFFSFLKQHYFLNDTLKTFGEMLKLGREMYGLALGAVLGEQTDPGIREKLYSTDLQINEKEKAIRRRIIEHLALQPTVDTMACLVMMSVVKDAERLGDYAKNLFEISEKAARPIRRDEYVEIFGDLDKKIDDHFKDTQKAFLESDIELNKKLVSDGKKHLKLCRSALDRLYDKSDYNANEAICMALLTRFQRRIIAHLGNIASSVIMPLDKIDFFDKNDFLE